MNRFRLLVLLVAGFLSTGAGSALDKKAVGVWASDGSKFYGNGMIHTGIAVYLREDGLGSITVGHPPLGYMIRVAAVIDEAPLVCVMSDSNAIRPCPSRLRLHDGKLEISSRESSNWEVLKKITDAPSAAMREDFAWDQYDGDVPRKPNAPSLKRVLRLMSLPDFRESSRRLKTVQALTVFQSVYWSYLKNKAFAVTAEGIYGYSASGVTDRKAAVNSALTYCEATRKKDGSVAPCMVVNVNGEWVE